jgi:hypothetical protein
VNATLEAINQMQADGVIGKYAIAQPPSAPHSSVLSLVPLYGYRKALGGAVPDEPIVVGGWPLQLLPPSNDSDRRKIDTGN